MTSRRSFLRHVGLGLTVTSLSPYFLLNDAFAHKFKLSLNPGAIGVSLNNEDLLLKASEYEFNALVPNIYEFKDWTNAKLLGYRDAVKNNGMSWGAVGLPVEFRKSESKFNSDYKQMAEMLSKLERIGITRMSTWIMPTHTELNYEQNMALHAVRLRKATKLLGEFNIKLGLEYVGPKTLRESQQYPFVSSLKEVKELIKVIGEENVGVQLDAFHWYCAGETAADIRGLRAEEIITVDLNDAIASRSKDEQLDWERELPGATGVIDLKSFLVALADIGYDGPIRAEPFNNLLNDMDNETALNATSEAMQNAVKLLD